MNYYTKNDIWFFLLISLPSLNFVIEPKATSYASILIITYIINIFMCVKDQRLILPSYFMYLFLSPLWFNWLNLNFVILNVIPWSFLVLYLLSRKKLLVKKDLLIFISMIILICLLSIISSDNREYALQGFLNFMNVMFLLIIASDYIRNNCNFIFFEKFVILVGINITSVMLAAFMKINLNDFLMMSGNIPEGAKSGNILFPKATYFYANIFYVLGAALLINFSFILSGRNRNISILIFIYLVLGFILFFNKTSFVALAFASLLCIYLCRKHIGRSVMLVLPVCLGLVFLSANYILSKFERISELLHFGSLNARISILPNIYQAYGLKPSILLTGSGPETLLRVPASHDQFFKLVKQSSNAIEGTVDSALASYLIELGPFFVVLFVLIMVYGIFIGLKGLPREIDKHAYSSVLGYGSAYYLYVLLCALSQVLAFGKVSFFVYFLLAAVFFGLRKSFENS